MYTNEKIFRLNNRTGTYTILQHRERLRPTSSTEQSSQNTKSQEMSLYKVQYKTWNIYFSDLIDNEMLSCGKNAQEAIERVKAVVPKDARDFSAYPMESVFGHKIVVE